MTLNNDYDDDGGYCYLSRLTEFLTSPRPQSLLSIHPNETVHEDFQVPAEWQDWWDWARVTREPHLWQRLMGCYSGSKSASDIPVDLCTMIDDIKTLQLIRERGSPVVPCYAACSKSLSCRSENDTFCIGMSPKKSHEVSCMSTYIAELLCSSDKMKGVKYVVDVGAGQGYLSRALRALGLHVLALDSCDVQARGAERRQTNDNSRDGVNGSLTYKLVNITPSSLIASIDDWIKTFLDGPLAPLSEEGQISVMIVALHACGSLTPDIFRASFSILQEESQRTWALASVVVVGCCYNMMSPQDFPLSGDQGVAAAVHLTSSHLQLSSQVPSIWAQDSSNNILIKSKAMDSVKKVAWRAMLESLLPNVPTRDACEKSAKIRLGRLNDKAYEDWTSFLAIASNRLKIPLSTSMEGDERELMERRLSILHVLRCLLGPCVESLIIWDRYVWSREILKRSCQSMRIELTNLFDQNEGSGRNIAMVLKPQSVITIASSSLV